MNQKICRICMEQFNDRHGYGRVCPVTGYVPKDTEGERDKLKRMNILKLEGLGLTREEAQAIVNRDIRCWNDIPPDRCRYITEQVVADGSCKKGVQGMHEAES